MKNLNNGIDVSVIIAAWNSANFISTAIDSALAQQNVTVEVIVVDDFSSDETCNVVESYTDPRVVLIRSNENGGPGAARNIGFSAAKGKWIAILDSDDKFLPNRLIDILGFDDGCTDVLIDSVFEQVEGTTELSPFFNKGELKLGEMSLPYLFESNLIYKEIKSTGYVKPIFKRDFVEKNKLKYWPEVRIGEDYYFLACCLLNNARVVVIDACAYIYSIRADSISGALKVADVEKLLSSDQKLTALYKLDKESKRALEYRTKNLLRAKEFIQLVLNIKAGRYLTAVGQMLCNPHSAYLLWLPLKKRIFK